MVVKIHIFNPEHDIALAAHQWQFTPPKAGRLMREALDYLPLLWAKAGEAVMVGDAERARREAVRMAAECGLAAGWPEAEIVGRREAARVLKSTMQGQDKTRKDGPRLESPGTGAPAGLTADGSRRTTLSPWGWDKAVVGDFARMAGMTVEAVMPGYARKQFDSCGQWLDRIRELSGRQWAARHLLPVLRDVVANDDIHARYITDISYLKELLAQGSKIVMKNPWSSSGRGVFYAVGQSQALQRASAIQRRLGGVMVEPYYDKVQDFAMEFLAREDGSVEYLGLSVFSTEGSQYAGNIVAPEEEKLQMLLNIENSPASLCFAEELLMCDLPTAVCNVMSQALKGAYAGPFGVDMMIYRRSDGSLALHPCVELNLRHTMGFAALAVACHNPDFRGVMRVDTANGLPRVSVKKIRC